MGDFPIALEVTVVGMVLVFGTLIICALVISALNRVFRPKPETEEEAEVEALEAVATQPVPITEPNLPSSLAPDACDEAAAIAVALALAAQQSNGNGRRVTYRPMMAPAVRTQAPEIDHEELAGEVVTVISIDPGSAVWSGSGRIKQTS